MSSRRKSKEKRNKFIKFSGGKKDGEKIEWESESKPSNKMYFCSRSHVYEYFLASRYSDDNKIEFLYVLLSKRWSRQDEDLTIPDQPYYNSHGRNRSENN